MRNRLYPTSSFLSTARFSHTPFFSCAARGALSCLALLSLCAASALAQTNDFQPNPAVGAGKVIVHSKFGGQIFGFDIDQNGTEGLLSEVLVLPNGNPMSAVETFDQKTGKILKVVIQTTKTDEFVTFGVFGSSVGLVERQHLNGRGFVTSRTYNTLNPLSANKLTGAWTPPLGSTHRLAGMSSNQGEPTVAVFATDESSKFIPWVFSSNVGANAFGPIVDITDSLNFGDGSLSLIGYDSTTNQAVLSGGKGCFGCFPVIGLVDLTNFNFTEFTGTGFGIINGLAVDSADGIACTTTEDDANVEFYTLATHTSVNVVLPGSGSQQFFSGADVQFDAIHKLFLVAQPNSSTTSSGSAIYVYNTKGALLETLNGFNFTTGPHIGLKPSTRSGYINGPVGFNEIQSFTY